jgi:transcriptional regulator with XRE-family HTH domain
MVLQGRRIACVSKPPTTADRLDAALCQTFGANVLRLRRQQDISQTQLAAASHISRSVITEIENGKHRNVTLSTARRIASALGTTINSMLS